MIDCDCTCVQCLRRVKGSSLLIGHFKYLLTYLLTEFIDDRRQYLVAEADCITAADRAESRMKTFQQRIQDATHISHKTDVVVADGQIRIFIIIVTRISPPPHPPLFLFLASTILQVVRRSEHLS